MYERFLAFLKRLFGYNKLLLSHTSNDVNSMPDPIEKPLTSEEKRMIARDREIAISRQKVADLLIYKQYYQLPIIDQIYSQIQLIHEAFDENDELEITKLDQFHLYYTDYLINLLKAKKKNGEALMKTMLGHQSHYQNEIQRLTSSIDAITSIDETTSDGKRSLYNMAVSTQLNAVYNRLIDNFNDFRYKEPQNFSSFKNSVKHELCYILPSETFMTVCEVDTDDKSKFYSYNDYHIERPLMAGLIQNRFNVGYVGSFVSASAYCEVFSLKNTEKFFVFIPDLSTFKIVQISKLKPYMTDKHTGLNSLVIERSVMKNKLMALQTKDNESKTFDDETLNSLKVFMQKIEKVDILEVKQSIEIERAMMDAALKLEQLPR